MTGSKNKDAKEDPYRYDIEFTEGGRIGEGADGAAFTCTNKFDLGNYVVKKLSFNSESEGRVRRREVQALASLEHRHIMQYFQSSLLTLGVTQGSLSIMHSILIISVSKEREEMTGSKNKDANEVGGLGKEQMELLSHVPTSLTCVTMWEVQALAALQHRHIMQYFQSWEEDGVAVELNSSGVDDEKIDPQTNTCFIIILETCPSFNYADHYSMKWIRNLSHGRRSMTIFRQILKG